MKTTKRSSSKTSTKKTKKTKKTAVKKTAAKKKTATKKKAVAKKTAAKKAAAKRATAKKSATKRTSSKRTAAKKTATRQSAPKKAAVKKAAKKKNAKKAVAKRVTKKRATNRRGAAKSTAEPVEALPYDYDEVVTRSRKALGKREGLTEQKMFGGLCFLLYGNMLGGVSGKHGLMVRVGPDAHADALAQPFARPMDITGRKMRGFVFVDAPGYENNKALKAWLERGVAFASTLPPKTKKTKA